MKTLSLTLVLLGLSACASSDLAERARAVRVVKASPAACEKVSEVEGRYQGASIASGSQLDKKEAARQDLLKSTAFVGADTVAVTRTGDEWLVGEAYNCGPRLPASADGTK